MRGMLKVKTYFFWLLNRFNPVQGDAKCACSGSFCPENCDADACQVSGACDESICCAADPARPNCSSCCISDNDSGSISGDPHIQTLQGDRYTLLKQGTFLAWRFSKDSKISSKAPVDWQLFAHYSGRHSYTRGLLLLDKSKNQAMEMTSDDCIWRTKGGSHWILAKSGHMLPNFEDSATKLRVVELESPDGKKLRARINLEMNTEHGTHRIARLYTQCKPGEHMNFKLTMYQKSDIDFVGGELGLTPKTLSKLSNESHMHFLSSKMMRMRTDTEFEAQIDWNYL